MARRRLSKRRIAALVVGLLAAAVAALPLYTVFFGTPQKISSLDLATPSTATRGSVATELRVARGPSEVGIERRKPTFETKDTEFIENTDHLVAGHQEPRPSDGSDESTTQTQTEEASSKKKSLPEVDDEASNVAGTANALSNDRPVFATFVSDGFHEFMLNWYAHVTEVLGIDNVIVAALDAKTELLCRERQIPFHSDAALRYTFDVVATGGQPLHDKTAKVTTRGKAFQQIGALKAGFLLYLLEKGHEVLVSDVDTVWLQDPRPYLHTERVTTEADIAVSTDCLSHKDEVKNGGCWHMQFNTGVLWLRPSLTTKKFVATWRDALVTTEHDFEHDQDIFNRLLRTEENGTRPGFKHVEGFKEKSTQTQGVNASEAPPALRVAARGVVLGALPMSLFCGGQVFFVQRLHEKLGVKPLVVHTTYQFSQLAGKRQRLREHGLWLLDDDAYYGAVKKTDGDGEGVSTETEAEGVSPRSKFVMVDPFTVRPPAHLVSTAGVSNHLGSAAWYRLVIRNLFAVAQVTNRIPILPKLICPCDRYWGDVLPGCQIGGAGTFFFLTLRVEHCLLSKQSQ
jgi:hypothetical protein|tara:strand:- start:3566 stop:5275 length:1710 start_codon:yes stop_codon:yes gene_type:complete